MPFKKQVPFSWECGKKEVVFIYRKSVFSKKETKEQKNLFE